MARFALGRIAPVLALLATACLDTPQPRSRDEGCPVFPADNPWNTDVSGYSVHADSDTWIDSIGRSGSLTPRFGTVREGDPFGIPYVEVLASQPRVPVSFTWDDASDPGPYPIPPDAPIEGGLGSDRRVIVVDVDACTLYEMIEASPVGGGTSWQADAGAVFDLTSNALRPQGWTSADSAGLPVFPGLVRYDEVVERGVIDHALRFQAPEMQAGYIEPARHTPGTIDDPTLPPAGARLRLKASYDCSSLSAEVQVICTALKTYGMLLASHGSAWFVSGAPDARWDDDALDDLTSIPGDAFEVVDTGDIIQR